MKKLLVFLTSFLLLLTSCKVNDSSIPTYDNENETYSDYNEFKLDNFKNIFDQEEGSYAVYFYQDDCNSCNKIKSSVLGYLSDYKKEERYLKIYLYNTSRLGNEYNAKRNEMNEKELRNYLYNNDIDSYENLIINVTPSLYVIADNKFYDYYEGSNIISYIFNIKESNYTLNSRNYDSRSYYDYKDNILNSLDDFYLLNDKKYYIYLFYIGCPYCAKIKTTILDYIESDNDINLYFYNVKKSGFDIGQENRNKFNRNVDSTSSNFNFDTYKKEMKENKVNTTSNTYFYAVPSLYIVEDGYFSDCVIGSDSIPSYLK